jgi:hypothetical protein
LARACALGVCSFFVVVVAGVPVEHVAQMPSVVEVEAKVHGDDPVDTQARRAAAFGQLAKVVRALSKGGAVGWELTPEECELIEVYRQAGAVAAEKGRALLATSGAPKGGPDSPGPTFFRLVERHRPGSSEPWILDEFPVVRDLYEARRSEGRGVWHTLEELLAGQGDQAILVVAFGVPLACAVVVLVLGLLPVLRFDTTVAPPGSPIA